MPTEEPPLTHSWLASERALPRLIARPAWRFLDTEAAGGIVLLLATCVALTLANSPLADVFESIWTTEIGIRVGALELSEDIRHWINDGLMTIFFFVVGLEIKRELVAGELREARRATLPAIAALGGMVVPATTYLAINSGGDASAGWGIPMATDIAFAVGVLALLGKKCPPSLKILLLSIAIVDDVGAIIVIAIFYARSIAIGWLGAACALTAIVVMMRRLRIWWTPIYVTIGAALWFATFKSGVHATIAGVALGLLAPARPADPEGIRDAVREAGLLSRDPDPATVRRTTIQAQELVSVAERLEHQLHPWTSFLIIPLFALANAGITIPLSDVGSSLSSPVVLGIVAGLVCGKLVGITTSSWLAVRMGLSVLPDDLSWIHVVGCGAVAGIGYTVALFISGLAFESGDVADEAKLAILLASTIAAALGVAILRRAHSSEQAPDRD